MLLSGVVIVTFNFMLHSHRFSKLGALDVIIIFVHHRPTNKPQNGATIIGTNFRLAPKNFGELSLESPKIIISGVRGPLVVEMFAKFLNQFLSYLLVALTYLISSQK